MRAETQTRAEGACSVVEELAIAPQGVARCPGVKGTKNPRQLPGVFPPAFTASWGRFLWSSDDLAGFGAAWKLEASPQLPPR